MRVKERINTSIKRSMAMLAVFFIISTSFIIVNLFVLGKNVFDLSLLQQSSYLAVMLMLTFLVVELNRLIKDSGIAIGLVISISFSLPYILQYSGGELGLSRLIILSITNILVITVASYAFENLWIGKSSKGPKE